MRDVSFASRNSVSLTFLLFIYLFVPLLLVRFFFIVYSLDTPQTFFIQEKLLSETRLKNESTVVFDSFGIEQVASEVPFIPRNIPTHGTLVFADANFEKDQSALVYSNAAVHLFSKNENQEFFLDSSLMSSVWVDNRLFVFTKNIFQENDNALHTFVYNTRKHIWKHNVLPLDIDMKVYKKSYALDKMLLLNTNKDIYMSNRNKFFLYKKNAQVFNFLGTKEFFALQFVKNNEDKNIMELELHIKDKNVITLVPYFYKSIVPHIISVNVEESSYVFVFSYAGKTYEVRLI